MKILYTNVKYPDDYKIQPGDAVEIIEPTKKSVGVYAVMSGHKGNKRGCSICVLSRENSGQPCPLPFTVNGWRLCSFTDIFFRPITDVMEEI
jgi:hypothetical protein